MKHQQMNTNNFWDDLNMQLWAIVYSFSLLQSQINTLFAPMQAKL